MQGFGTAVQRYQDALLEYRAVFKSDPAAASVARQKVIDAFQKLQEGFQREINIVKSGIRRSKSLALTRSSRGLNIARNSLAVIDFGSRVSHIHDSYKAGDDWCREMFIESFSFAASAGGGLGVAGSGSALAEAALATFVAATPAGWVLIVVGLGVAAAAAGTSILLDSKIKENAGSWYDSIMRRTSIK
jgi:hypothetical protein